MPEIDPRCGPLLQAALDLAHPLRDHFVERECGDDAVLLARMRALLAVDEAEWSLLDQPIDALSAGLFDVDAPSTDDADHAAGQHIGPYRLLRELGRGGMGSVWLAERIDGQFSQQVALKLIKLGMDSALVQSQFRHEREILARLQHPNIAHLIDGGIDGRGRPWFAMALVEGVGLRQWIERDGPDFHQRLRLFVKLCRAVAHAHQQLVVHRDLKPGNVLVQADGEPRLLDFGIAKLLEDDPAHTATQHRFLTRDFAAPEQLRGEAVTTATDVYALGLILFELLTGSRYRALHEAGQGTLRPSATPATAVTIDAGISRRQLRGDLDAIIMCALADDPERRYPGAQALADDMQRHLDGKPIEARPDGFAYRSAKFARRHRAAVAVAAIGLIALLGASGVAFWQAHAKTQEAERARIALRQSETTRDFIQSVFLGADPTRSKGTATTAGELLAAAHERVPRELGNEPAIAAQMLEQIGNTYVSLGEDELARSTLREALAFNAKAAQPSVLIEASAGGRLAHYDYMDGHTGKALAELDRLIAALHRRGADVEVVLSKTLQLKGNVLFAANRIDEALALSAQAAEVLRPRASEWPSEYALALAVYADAAAGAGNGALALEAAERALAQPLLDNANAPAAKLMALGVKVRALQALHRDAEAEPLLAKVIAGQSALFGANMARTRYWRYRHAQLLQALDRLDQAQQVIDALIAQPADDIEQPVAHIAHAVTGAAIAVARHATDADPRVVSAEAIACADDGNPRFCDQARALRGNPR